MIYYAAHTQTYLRDVLDRVARGASHYLVFDVPQAKAERTLEKLTNRYRLDATKFNRTYALNKKNQPVLDACVLQTRNMSEAQSVRICLIVTLPANVAIEAVNALYAQTESEKEQFFEFTDRKHRLVHRSTSLTGRKNSVFSVYELVRQPYHWKDRKKAMTGEQSESDAQKEGWTWRLHKEFLSVKRNSIEDAFKKAQKLAKTPDRLKKQDALIEAEIQSLHMLAPFRAVRAQIFDLKHDFFKYAHSYLNRKLSVELKPMPYSSLRNPRILFSLDELLSYHTTGCVKKTAKPQQKQETGEMTAAPKAQAARLNKTTTDFLKKAHSVEFIRKESDNGSQKIVVRIYMADDAAAVMTATTTNWTSWDAHDIAKASRTIRRHNKTCLILDRRDQLIKYGA